MIDRMSAGEIPKKPHTALRGASGELRHEQCFTRAGFDGPFSILYHLHAPHVHEAWSASPDGWAAPVAGYVRDDNLLLRRHYRSQELSENALSPLNARVPMLFSEDIVASVAKPGTSDTCYFENVDGDDLHYIHEGRGVLRTSFGDVSFQAEDYLYIPRGVRHRFILEEGVTQVWFTMELLGDMHVPTQFRNPVGQLKMDAPYTHRDFRRPVFSGPVDEGIRTVVGKRHGRFTAYEYKESPLDVVGWDGTVWPWAFPIRAFQPKTSTVHLPPTIHTTFAARGALICSFVPRLVDYHPESIPCPYPHSSVNCDEIIFYCKGNFTSRKGIDSGSISHHPNGTMHGPHPGAYEESMGHRETNELAVMIDTFKPLMPTTAAADTEDIDYHASFRP